MNRNSLILFLLCLSLPAAASPLMDYIPAQCRLYANATRYVLERTTSDQHRRLLRQARRDPHTDITSLILKQALWNAARYRRVDPVAAGDITLGACLGKRREPYQHYQYTGPH